MRCVRLLLLFFLGIGSVHAEPLIDEIPEPPASGIWDRRGYLDVYPESEKRISDALIHLKQEHGYELYLVIDGVVFGNRAKKLASEIEGRWVQKGRGMVLLYESDKKRIVNAYNPDVSKEVTEGKAIVPSNDLIEIFSDTLESSKKFPEDKVFIELFVLELCGNYEKALTRAEPPPVKGNKIKLAFVFIGGLGIMSLIGVFLGMLLGRDGGKRRRVKYFPEVNIPERLGAPYGSGWVSLQFRKDENE